MRIVVMGTGGFAVPTFQSLANSDHEVLALITRPPHGRKPPPNPMRLAAEALGIPVEMPASVNSPQAREYLTQLAGDLFVVCDYGQILSDETLALARLGGVNLHGSLLPAYRGAAPVNWAIYDGCTETGVTIIHMTPRLDAGPCLVQRRLAIAMSLVNEPELLVLDEPTTGLDPAVRMALWSRVRALRDAGTSVLLTTHDMDEAERLCDRVAILSEGRRVCEGSPRDLIEQRLAREAVEIDCSDEEERRLLAGTHWPHLRSGERLIVYTDDPAQVVARAQARAGGAHSSLAVRPTNLEDVFLAETGTRLEEQP